MFKWLSTLGNKATRSDLWVLGILSVLGWSLWSGDTTVMLTIAGYMAADLVGKEAIQSHKEINFKKYETTYNEPLPAN